MSSGCSVTTEFIAAATNRQPGAVGCSEDSLVAFGSYRFLGFWDASRADYQGVSATIPGHDGEVTCVAFVSKDLVGSADDKGKLLIRRINVDDHQKWNTVASAQAHEKGVTTLCAFGKLIVTGGSDSRLKIWEFNSASDSLHLNQTIDLKGRFPLDVKLAVLPQSAALIMALASTERVIRIYTQTQEGFTLALTLEGHEDWIRCLSFDSFAPDGLNDKETLTLASGSQDTNIRLWVIKPKEDSSAKSNDLLDAFEQSLADLGDEEGGRRISNRSHVFAIREDSRLKHYTFTFDALLIGHENHVTSVGWRTPSPTRLKDVPTLLSASTDASLILWSPTDSSSPIWVNRQRFGDIGGGKAGGFVGALWGCKGDEVMGWGWHGGWRRWRKLEGEARDETWGEVNAITGHQAPVKGLAWDPKGDYLITSSLDQTTRIFGPWRRSNDHTKDATETWHELARPQIHGYDLIAPAFITPLRFVSVADEKVARVFDAPKGFVHVVKGLGSTSDRDVIEEARPVGASVPPLGLSNKAAMEDDETFREVLPATRPPFEGELANVTLWPELEKLFGHGYELYALGVSHSGSVIATACKSTSPEHAVIRLYDTKTWRPIGSPLPGHSLTVTRIAFSPDDRFILTSSRDRSWRLFERQVDGSYASLTGEKGHARIIWDCAWTAENDGIFATAARDKLVKIWQREDDSGNKWKPIVSLKLEESATAVDFSPVDVDQRRRMAIGLETGTVVIYSSLVNESAVWTLDATISSNLAHVDQVHRVAWRPCSKDSQSKYLATSSEDGSVRVLKIVI